MSKFFTLLFLSWASLSACKTTAPTPTEESGPRKTMLKYQDNIRLPELWEQWTPIPETAVPALFSKAAPFDYWRVTDENEIEDVWSVLSTIVSGLISQTKDEQRKLSLRSTLTILEPSPTDRSVSTLDFTFLTSAFSEKKIDRWEGVVIRWSKKTYDASPTITLFLSRQAASKTGAFDRARLWIEPGFSEIEPQSFNIQLEKNWSYRAFTGLNFDFQEGEKQDAKIYANTLNATLWKKVTKGSYVKYEKAEKGGSGSVFGEIKLRDIEMVFERTQFPPRFNF